MNALVVFVEGQADGWYVLRSLGQLAGAKLDARRPADLPTPFGRGAGQATQTGRGLILQWHDRAPLDRSLAASAEGHEPVFQAVASLPSGDLVFIVRMGGDRKSQEVSDLIHQLDLIFAPSLRHDVRRFALAFIFDADTPGHYQQMAGDCVCYREQRFAQDYAAHLGTGSLQHASWMHVRGIPWGLFVLHDGTQRAGTLEALIEPPLQTPQHPQWQARLAAADLFLTTNQLPIDEVCTSSSSRAKARLAIAGQFNHAGESLAQILRRGDPKKDPCVPDAVFNTGDARLLVDFLLAVRW